MSINFGLLNPDLQSAPNAFLQTLQGAQNRQLQRDMANQQSADRRREQDITLQSQREERQQSETESQRSALASLAANERRAEVTTRGQDIVSKDKGLDRVHQKRMSDDKLKFMYTQLAEDVRLREAELGLEGQRTGTSKARLALDIAKYENDLLQEEGLAQAGQLGGLAGIRDQLLKQGKGQQAAQITLAMANVDKAGVDALTGRLDLQDKQQARQLGSTIRQLNPMLAGIAAMPEGPQKNNAIKSAAEFVDQQQGTNFSSLDPQQAGQGLLYYAASANSGVQNMLGGSKGAAGEQFVKGLFNLPEQEESPRDSISFKDVESAVKAEKDSLVQLQNLSNVADQFLRIAESQEGTLFEPGLFTEKFLQPAAEFLASIGMTAAQAAADPGRMLAAYNTRMGLLSKPSGSGAMSDPEMDAYLGTAPSQGWSLQASRDFKEITDNNLLLARAALDFKRSYLERNKTAAGLESAWARYRANNPIVSVKDGQKSLHRDRYTNTSNWAPYLIPEAELRRELERRRGLGG